MMAWVETEEHTPRAHFNTSRLHMKAFPRCLK